SSRMRTILVGSASLPAAALEDARSPDALAKWIPSIDIRVDHKERIHVVQPDQEFALRLSNRGLLKPDRGPRRLTAEEQPAHRVGAFMLKDVRSLLVVLLALRHLQPVLSHQHAQ